MNSLVNPSSKSFRSKSAFSYTGFGICRGSVRKPLGVRTSIRWSGWMIPVRKVMEEMCPSPVARKLRIKRRAPGRQVRLVRVRDDGGIEQGRRFQGVFGQEIGADQQLSLFGEFLIGQQEVADLFESFQKEFADLLVALGEFGGDFVQERADSLFRQRHDPGDDPADPLGISRIEWPQKNAGLVGLEDGGRAFDVDRICIHGLVSQGNETGSGDYFSTAIGSLKLVSMFCANRISANESRKARVDSAPWFPLTRSTCNPSRQPPVSGE